MEMKNIFVELKVNGGGIFEDTVKWCDKLFSTGRHFA